MEALFQVPKSAVLSKKKPAKARKRAMPTRTKT
jgi:hypothetical protein